MGYTRENIRWFLHYLFRYPKMTTFTVIGSIIEIILYSLPSLFIAKFMVLFQNNAENEIIFKWLILMIIVSSIQPIVFYFVGVVNEFLAHRISTDMTYDLFINLQSRPLYYHDRQKIGDIMARATGDTRIINIGISPAFRIVGQILTAFIFSIVILFLVNFQLAVILLVSFPFYAYSIYLYGKKLVPLSQQIQQEFSELNITTSESFRNIREIKSYTLEKKLGDKFNFHSVQHAKKIQAFGVQTAYYYPGLIMTIVLALTVVTGVYLVVIGQLTFPGLVLFIGMIANLLWLGGNLQWLSEFTVKTGVSIQRLRETIEDQISITKFGNKEFNRMNAEIKFINVSFKYDNDGPYILKNINLHIPDGETVVIVGGPGSGKSSFIKLLLRLYQPTEGEIIIGDHNLKEYSNQSFRENISSIEQDTFLFSNTVRWNITFGKEEIEDDKIWKVARLAYAEGFIKDMENGLDTEIGERGIRLSGGMKQRLAIARALLIDPAILIMDDASSALDSETEFQIQQAIQNVLETRTSIIITHRISMIASADRVIVFRKGEIIGNAPHNELIKSNEFYRSLFSDHYELPTLIAGE